mmetsp:Transcript_151283/g.275255  ORF Transcript_151283/g.275255 Transcript_151283/m.275255 type:complete len:207 (+) Transcript_151283:216-836(+)
MEEIIFSWLQPLVKTNPTLCLHSEFCVWLWQRIHLLDVVVVEPRMFTAKCCHNLETVGHLFLIGRVVIWWPITSENTLESHVTHILESHQFICSDLYNIISPLALDNFGDCPVIRKFSLCPHFWIQYCLVHCCNWNVALVPFEMKNQLLCAQLPIFARVGEGAHYKSPAQLVHHKVAHAHCPLGQVVLVPAPTKEKIHHKLVRIVF